ncbi:MAG: tail fiber domain-containing protein [Bacteroidota bacterium]
MDKSAQLRWNLQYDLRPVTFQYKEDESKTKQYGLIAEEVEKVNPILVSYNSDGEPETVSYSQLIAPMIKALQNQAELINELEGRIAKLKGK